MNGEATEQTPPGERRPAAGNPHYESHHPKWYRRRIPVFTRLRKWAYTKFIVRELTAVFVLYAAMLLLVQIRLVSEGPAAHARFQAWLESPGIVAFHVVVFAALLFHGVTWLNLAPKAIVLRFSGRRVPDRVVLVAHYAAWIGTSALLAWLLAGR